MSHKQQMKVNDSTALLTLDVPGVMPWCNALPESCKVYNYKQREFGKENLVLKGLSWCGNTIYKIYFIFCCTTTFQQTTVEMCLQLYIPYSK